MAYSTNPNFPKARVTAMQLLIREQLPLAVVANNCGIHRSTVWRLKRKCDELNCTVQLTNDNRPGRSSGRRGTSQFRMAASARPHIITHGRCLRVSFVLFCLSAKNSNAALKWSGIISIMF